MPAASGTGALPGDEDGPWDDAGLSDTAGLYQGCPRIRAPGSWDNPAGDRDLCRGDIANTPFPVIKQPQVTAGA